MILRVVRAIYIIMCMVAGGVITGTNAPAVQHGVNKLAEVFYKVEKVDNRSEQPSPEHASGGFALGLFSAGLLLGLIVGTESINWISKGIQSMEEMDPDQIFAMVGGIVLGLIITGILFPLLTQAGKVWPFLLIIVALIAILLSVTAMNRLVDLLPWTNTKKVRRKAIKILDTNIIIDGRISDILRSGFLEGQVYVPRFVLEELQLIADSSDSLRRSRGRRGLDILNLMSKDFHLDIGTQDKYLGDIKSDEEVDSRLVKLAKAIGGDIVTNDYNLNKVAELQGVKVLNVNDLALALRPTVLPGEELTVTMIKEGKEQEQGIGYLVDGTMVVVEGGRNFMNETLDVCVTSVLQTQAGKMLFAEIRDPNSSEGDTAVDQSMRAFTRGRTRRPIR